MGLGELPDRAGTRNMNLKPEYSLSSLAAVLMVSVDVKQDLKKKKTVRAVAANLKQNEAQSTHAESTCSLDLMVRMYPR